MLSPLTRYARSFFTSAPISQEQAQAAKDTVEVSRRMSAAVTASMGGANLVADMLHLCRVWWGPP